jgi:Domain of unknown function (DUF4440)
MPSPKDRCNSVSHDVQAAIAEVLRAEELRCQAISNGRWGDLAKLLAEDGCHTHISGRSESNTVFIHSLKTGVPRMVTRYDLRARIYGDVAVMTGRQILTLAANEGGDAQKPLDYAILQVWRRTEGAWREVAFQASGTRLLDDRNRRFV